MSVSMSKLQLKRSNYIAFKILFYQRNFEEYWNQMKNEKKTICIFKYPFFLSKLLLQNFI